MQSNNDQICRLCLDNRAGGAGAFASAAIDAGVSVDDVLSVALADRVDGAGGSAASAADAGIINNTCHFDVLLSIFKYSHK